MVGKHMRTRLTNISVIPKIAGLPGVADADPRYAGRYEARLAKAVDINQFGVNIVILRLGAFSANRHWHEAEDEMVYVLDGSPTLVDENGRHKLKVGDIVGFVAGEPNAHHIVNEEDREATLMVVGSRKPGQETIHYPDDNFGPIRK
jgi:uncharacterized cupin superfamily protein